MKDSNRTQLDCCCATVLYEHLTGGIEKYQRIILKSVLEKYVLIMRSCLNKLNTGVGYVQMSTRCLAQ
jgi:hypothetical protein